MAPASVHELQELIATASGTVRPVGAGHSFSPLVPTDDTIVSLSRLSGLVSHDPQRLQATLWAGSRLGDIGQPLEDAGQALVNMPDIDEQTLAGCLATATHGTGAGIGCMSTFIEGLQLVDARGDLVECDANNNAELFQAAQGVPRRARRRLPRSDCRTWRPIACAAKRCGASFDEMLDIADEHGGQAPQFRVLLHPVFRHGLYRRPRPDG